MPLLKLKKEGFRTLRSKINHLPNFDVTFFEFTKTILEGSFIVVQTISTLDTIIGLEISGTQKELFLRSQI